MSATLENLPWFLHEDGLLESIDVDPTGRRISSAGSWWLCIWNAEIFTSPFIVDILLSGLNFSPRFLSVAKWNRNGSQLAFAGDNGFVAIARRFAGAGMIPLEDGSKPSTENWQQAVRLFGHSCDVVDVCWSPNDHLASASLDNTILIWNVHTQQRIWRLDGHHSFVKAISWDPQNTYLASISDDRSLILWDVGKGQMLRKITEPFQRNPVSSYNGLKIDWSPDGAKLVVVNVGKNEMVQLMVIVNRVDWRREYRGIQGHGTLTIAKFNPCQFQKDQQKFYYWASGGTSGLVSVWPELIDSHEDAPSHDKCPPETVEVGSGVCDLTWTPDGYALLIATTVGQVLKWTLPKWSLGIRIEGDQPVPAEVVLEPESVIHLKEGGASSHLAQNQKQLTKKRIRPERLETYDDSVEKKTLTKDRKIMRMNQKHRFKKKNSVMSRFRVPVKSRRSSRYLVEIRNQENVSHSSSKIQYQECGVITWSIQLNCQVCLAVANAKYLLIVMRDGSLQILNLACGMILNCLYAFDEELKCIDCDENCTLMTVSTKYNVTLWDISLLLKKQSISIPIRVADPWHPIKDLTLFSSEYIVVHKDHIGHVYSLQTQEWTETTLEELQTRYNSNAQNNSSNVKMSADREKGNEEAKIPSDVVALEITVAKSESRGMKRGHYEELMRLAYLLLRLYSSEKRWTGRKILALCDRILSESNALHPLFRQAFQRELWSIIRQDSQRYRPLAIDMMYKSL